MAYQLANYTTDSGITLTAAYLRITNVQIQKDSLSARVSCEIYADQAASAAEKTVVATGEYTFLDAIYTANFDCVPGTDPSGTQPTTVDGILQTQAYLALKNHPSLTTILAGATSV